MEILFTFSTIISSHLIFIKGISNKNSDDNNGLNLGNENLKFLVVSGKIHIINNSGWADFRNDGNCTGSGTYSDPYVIEDLVIDGGGSGSCIWIENSDVFFKIENCNVYNSGIYPGMGIKLINVNNSQIINNNCSFSFAGIYLEYSNNNNLSGNTAHNNYYGKYLSYSKNNNLLGNTAHNNYEDGIHLYKSDNNHISGNIVNYNNKDGIKIWMSDYNQIFGNSANNNTSGIDLEGGEHNKILGNLFFNNRWGIKLGYHNSFGTFSGNVMNGCGLEIYGSNTLEELCSHDIDTTNLVNGKYLYYYKNKINLRLNNFLYAGQVILANVNDSTISNLILLYGTSGISLYYSNNNIISGNIINKNFEIGIYLECSNNNEISKNYISYNDHGIHLRESNNNKISKNYISYNDHGICLREIINNLISGNIVNKNFDDGITDQPIIMQSHDNTITKNIIQNNGGNGIRLSGDNNIITKNKLEHNKQDGLKLHGGNNNIISENEINDNYEYGIYVVGENNKIYLNCFYNHLFNAYDNGWNNDWDNGTIGNYWDTWDHPSFDINNDGIVDIPCPIPGSAGSQDNFPLLKCPISTQDGGGIPIELIILSSGGVVLGISILLLIIKKRKRV
ncbi:MAG: NosD domain-containing protein [Candidatus Hermodarchaeota archaeon]